jgi:hypothetical protein
MIKNIVCTLLMIIGTVFILTGMMNFLEVHQFKTLTRSKAVECILSNGDMHSVVKNNTKALIQNVVDQKGFLFVRTHRVHKANLQLELYLESSEVQEEIRQCKS